VGVGAPCGAHVPCVIVTDNAAVAFPDGFHVTLLQYPTLTPPTEFPVQRSLFQYKRAEHCGGLQAHVAPLSAEQSHPSALHARVSDTCPS
jgi:hypothetical protein